MDAISHRAQYFSLLTSIVSCVQCTQGAEFRRYHNIMSISLLALCWTKSQSRRYGALGCDAVDHLKKDKYQYIQAKRVRAIVNWECQVDLYICV